MGAKRGACQQKRRYQKREPAGAHLLAAFRLWIVAIPLLRAWPVPLLVARAVCRAARMRRGPHVHRRRRFRVIYHNVSESPPDITRLWALVRGNPKKRAALRKQVRPHISVRKASLKIYAPCDATTVSALHGGPVPKPGDMALPPTVARFVRSAAESTKAEEADSFRGLSRSPRQIRCRLPVPAARRDTELAHLAASDPIPATRLPNPATAPQDRHHRHTTHPTHRIDPTRSDRSKSEGCSSHTHTYSKSAGPPNPPPHSPDPHS